MGGLWCAMPRRRPRHHDQVLTAKMSHARTCDWDQFKSVGMQSCRFQEQEVKDTLRNDQRF